MVCVGAHTCNQLSLSNPIHGRIDAGALRDTGHVEQYSSIPTVMQGHSVDYIFYNMMTLPVHPHRSHLKNVGMLRFAKDTQFALQSNTCCGACNVHLCKFTQVRSDNSLIHNSMTLSMHSLTYNNVTMVMHPSRCIQGDGGQGVLPPDPVRAGVPAQEPHHAPRHQGRQHPGGQRRQGQAGRLWRLQTD